MNMNKSRKPVDWLSNVLFPRRCPWCDRVLGFAPGCTCGVSPQELALEGLKTAARLLPGGNALDAILACFRYEEPVRSAIHRMKFEDRPDLHRPLGLLMASGLPENGAAPVFDTIVPVPSYKKAVQKRGYNQSALLAGVLARHTGARYAPQLLAKTRATRQQMLLGREERLQNLAGAFAAKPAAGAHVLLVDDVVTTGSTLNECAGALKRAGAAWCGAFCLASAE